MTYSSYGSGYMCLTDKGIYLFSLAQVSRKFPLHEQGLFANFIAIGFSKQNRSLEKSDMSWSIPYHTVAGAQITGETIKIVTAALVWEVYEHFNDHIPVIMAGINAGLSGKFAGISRTEIQTSAKSGNNSVIDLLKGLNELRTQGIISETEFEQKKKDLLARL